MPALVGSLILVAMIRQGDAANTSPAYIIGYNLADFLSGGFIAISAFLGALGSFFSGSTTVSNLTFGLIQKVRGVCLIEYSHPQIATQCTSCMGGPCRPHAEGIGSVGTTGTLVLNMLWFTLKSVFHEG